MVESLFGGLVLVLQWPAVGYLILGVLIGMWLGAVPGLAGIVGMVIVLPFTFGMEPAQAFALLLGLFAVTTTSDTIASVMLGIPGTAASQATILDGYPLAMKGEAARAFGAAFTVSAFGGVFGGIVLAVSLPIILPMILAFGSPEFFMLGLLGLTMVGSLSSSSVLKGLLSAAMGLMMATVGYGEASPIPRYWFGFDYTLDGLPLLPVVLGLFALPEVMDLAVRDTSISRVPKDQVGGGGMRQGIRDVISHWWLVLRCSAIGVYIGMIPGLGSSIVDWIAYGYAVQSAKDKTQFGHGDIRGVIAPEAANNAVRGGSMIPTVALGIPGSAANAILLSALLIQGLNPGQEMLTTKLDITFSMVWSLILANIMAAGLLMAWASQVAKIAFIRGHLIVPGVLVFVFMGAWMSSADIGDWILLLIMGMVGAIMKRSGWPRPPLVLAIILGPIMENAFHLSTQAYGTGWLLRPVSVGIGVLIVLTLIFSTRGIIRNKFAGEGPVRGEGAERNPVISWPFSILLVVLFAGAAIMALDWPTRVKQFPLVISPPALVLAVVILVHDAIDLMRERRQAGSIFAMVTAAADSALLGKSVSFLGWLLGILVVALLVGQVVAIPLFVALYLFRWGGYGWRTALGYAAAAWVVLFGFYDSVLHIVWHPSLLFG
jgi:TctA family transporter